MEIEQNTKTTIKNAHLLTINNVNSGIKIYLK